MAIPIITADQSLQVNAIITYLYADPGLGKTSIGFTGDKAISFDFDRGAHRTGELRRGAVVPVQNWKQSCEEAEHAGDLNQLTESLDKEHMYYQSMRQALKAQAKKMKCSFNMVGNRWINPPEYTGINDHQRDQLQDFIAECGLDTRTVCEHLGIDSLMQIEVSQLQAVQKEISALAKQGIQA